MNLLRQLLSILRALHWSHWTSHWKAKGENSYQTHLLFQRLYKAIEEDIDMLAEKIVGEYGPEALGDIALMTGSAKFLSGHGGENLVPRALEMEEHLQTAIKTTYEELKASGELSLGMDDYLMALASAHETNLFLLRQNLRTASEKVASTDHLAALSQPKGMKPTYEGNGMAVPLVWGGVGVMKPYDVARAMLPLFHSAKNGVAFVLDQNSVFAKAGLPEVEKALVQAIQDQYDEEYAMTVEYHQDAPKGSRGDKEIDRAASITRKLRDLRVSITQIRSPKTGKSGLKVVFQPGVEATRS